MLTCKNIEGKARRSCKEITSRGDSQGKMFKMHDSSAFPK